MAASGNPNDHDRLTTPGVCKEGADADLANFRSGNVPRADVALLMRASVAMLNPSLFEGWSTTVEEAKSLGVRLVLADLPVHREQVGAAADFFDPVDPAAIAACLERVWVDEREGPAVSEQQAIAEQALRRVREFAAQFTRACERACARSRRPAN